MKMEQTECSETSAYKPQTLGNYPKERGITQKKANNIWGLPFTTQFQAVF
jgi:hypothetical protein